MQVVIGSKTLDVAEPIASRYYALTELLSVPKFEAILEKQNEIDALREKLMKSTSDNERLQLQKQMQEINADIQKEMNKHGFDIERLFREGKYDMLAQIVETVCKGDVSAEDIQNCFEVEVKIAVDFFLAERLRISTSIAQSYATFVQLTSNSNKSS